MALLAAATHRSRERPGTCWRADGPHVGLDDAELVIVRLGGDGFMLETLHGQMPRGLPIYGMNLGTVGFLLNSFGIDELAERLARATEVALTRCAWRPPPRMAPGSRGSRSTRFRSIARVRQAARLAIEIEGSHACRNWSATGCWWQRQRAVPPTICRPMGRSCRSTPISWH